MNRFKNRLGRAIVPSIFRDDRGLSTVEYTIILVLIAVAGIGLWSQFGDVLSGKIGEATEGLEDMQVESGDNRGR